MIPLYQTKTADTAQGICASMTRPFFHFRVGPGDEAKGKQPQRNKVRKSGGVKGTGEHSTYM